MLKNAKDACATEAAEIATYTALERLARSVGDKETAELAAAILADEEKMLQRVLRQIPKLTEAVVRADHTAEPSNDLSATGAADTVRAAGKTATDGARRTTAAAKRTARQAPTGPGAGPDKGQLKDTAPPDSDLAIASFDPAGADEADTTSGAYDDLRSAAAGGDGAAACTLGERLRETDFAAAEGWLRTAANLGEVRAAKALGMLLWERRDLDAAEAMLRSAAADPEGAHALGLLLWRERHDSHAAVESLDRAAQVNDHAAQRDLGIALRDHGDLHGAHYWLSRAANRDGEARQVLAALNESR